MSWEQRIGLWLSRTPCLEGHPALWPSSTACDPPWTPPPLHTATVDLPGFSAAAPSGKSGKAGHNDLLANASPCSFQLHGPQLFLRSAPTDPSLCATRKLDCDKIRTGQPCLRLCGASCSPGTAVAVAGEPQHFLQVCGSLPYICLGCPSRTWNKLPFEAGQTRHS